MNRRSFIGLVMFATMAPTLARWAQAAPPAALQRRTGGDVDLANLEEVTIAELQAAMEEGEFTAVELVNAYIERIEAIDQDGPRLNSILEINPDALDIAQALDEGSVFVNDWAKVYDSTEEGGFKQSGLGRLNGVAAIEDFVEYKHIALRPGLTAVTGADQ